MGAASEAVAAGGELRSELATSYFQDFNVQEILWHMVLMRERFAAQGKLRSPGVLAVRRGLFATCQWGPGGMWGLRLFFPGATEATCGEKGVALRTHLEQHHGLTFVELHAVQWGLCAFQTINPGYTRQYVQSLKPVVFFATWHTRVANYPSGRQLFKAYVEGLGDKAVEDWEAFLGHCKKAWELLEAKALAPKVSCRACWCKAGLDVTGGSKTYTHACYTINFSDVVCTHLTAKGQKRKASGG